MKKIFCILLGVLFSLNIAFAQKTVSYQLNYSFDKDSSAFAKNYSCNLKNLENDSAQLIRQEKWGDLLVVFDKCIAQYPTYPYLYNNRGNAYKTMYKLEEALIDYEKAIELDSEYINPYIGKAPVLILQSEYEKAINILN